MNTLDRNVDALSYSHFLRISPVRKYNTLCKPFLKLR